MSMISTSERKNCLPGFRQHEDRNQPAKLKAGGLKLPKHKLVIIPSAQRTKKSLTIMLTCLCNLDSLKHPFYKVCDIFHVFVLKKDCGYS